MVPEKISLLPRADGLMFLVEASSTWASQEIHGNNQHKRIKAYLHERQVLFPPDILGVHANEVVGVHDGVDEAIEDDREVHVAVVPGVDVQPVELVSKSK